METGRRCVFECVTFRKLDCGWSLSSPMFCRAMDRVSDEAAGRENAGA